MNNCDIFYTNKSKKYCFNNAEKVTYKMDYHILHTVLSVIILLFLMTTVCYDFVKHRSKEKKYYWTNIKMKKNILN